MLSNSTALNASSFEVKMIFEVICDDFGYTFISDDTTEGKIQANIGDNPIYALSRLAYEVINVLPLQAVFDGAGSEQATMLEALRMYLTSEVFVQKANALPDMRIDSYNPYTRKQREADLRVFNALYESKDSGYLDSILDTLFQKTIQHLALISPNYIVLQACSRLSRIQVGLRRSAIYSKSSRNARRNQTLFKNNPSLVQALAQDFYNWLPTGMDIKRGRDQTVIMTLVMGHFINRYFLPDWFKNKMPMHVSNDSVIVDGVKQSKSNFLTVQRREFADFDIHEALVRMQEVSTTLFRHASLSNKIQVLRNQIPEEYKDYTPYLSLDQIQYTILEFYISCKLERKLNVINSNLYSVLHSADHKIPKSPINNYTKHFVLDTEYQAMRLSNIPSLSVANEFRSRISMGKSTLKLIYSFRNKYRLQNSDKTTRELALVISDNSEFDSDSDYNYLRYHHIFRMTPELHRQYPELPKLLLSDEAYTRINKVMQCFADLDLLDDALGRYGLSIIDMAAANVLEASTVENINTFGDLLTYIINGRHMPDFELHDAYSNDIYCESGPHIEHFVRVIPKAQRNIVEREAKENAKVQLTALDLNSSSYGTVITSNKLQEPSTSLTYKSILGAPFSQIFRPMDLPYSLGKFLALGKVMLGKGFNAKTSDSSYSVSFDTYSVYTDAPDGMKVLDAEKTLAEFSTYLDVSAAINSIEFLSSSTDNMFVRLVAAMFFIVRNPNYLEAILAPSRLRPLSQQVQQLRQAVGINALASRNIIQMSEKYRSDALAKYPSYAQYYRYNAMSLSTAANTYIASSKSLCTALKPVWGTDTDLNLVTPGYMIGDEEMDYQALMTLGHYGLRKLRVEAKIPMPLGLVIKPKQLNPENESLYTLSFVDDGVYPPNIWDDSLRKPIHLENIPISDISQHELKSLLDDAPYSEEVFNGLITNVQPAYGWLRSLYTGFVLPYGLKFLQYLFVTDYNPFGDLENLHIISSCGAFFDAVMIYYTTLVGYMEMYNTLLDNSSDAVNACVHMKELSVRIASREFIQTRVTNSKICSDYTVELKRLVDNLEVGIKPLAEFIKDLDRIRKHKGCQSPQSVINILSDMGIFCHKNIIKIGGLEDTAYTKIAADIITATTEIFVTDYLADLVKFINQYYSMKDSLHKEVLQLTGMSCANIQRNVGIHEIFYGYASTLLGYVNTEEFQQRCAAYSLDAVSVSEFQSFAADKVTQTSEIYSNVYDPFLRYKSGQHVVGKCGNTYYFPHEAGVFVGLDLNDFHPILYTYKHIKELKIEWS